jgi:hypothetical protein
MKLYREDQRYHDMTTIVLIAMVTILLAATVISRGLGLWKVLIGLVFIAAIVLVVLNLRMKIRISRKKMSIRIAPIPWSRIQLDKDEVTGVEFIASNTPDLANSLTLHYGGKLRIFNFGDNKGMIIHRADGRDVVVLSRQLYDDRGSVMEQLKLNGWELSQN